jgi:hypothetical protein
MHDFYKFIREKNRDSFRVKYALKSQERKQLIRDCGIHGLVLFEYYLRMASIEDVGLDDEAAAEYFDWSTHTARRWRRELINHGWLHIERATLSQGQKITLYYLGKDEVSRLKANQEKKGP